MTTRTGSADAAVLRAAREGAAWFAPEGVATVLARGAEARRFCNGMFTNNVRDLPKGGANRSALVDDRGRIGGFLDLLCLADDRFLLAIEGLSVEAFLERYEKYAMLDDVELEPQTSVVWSVQGPRIELAAIGLPTPEPGRYAEVDGAWIWRRVRSPAGGYDLALTDPSRFDLDRIAVRAGPDDADALRVAAGRPVFPADTGDKRLPAEIGLRDELLAFDKGCYLGQESIHRIDVMGDVKKRLVGVRFQGPADPGAPVTVGDAKVGELTSPVALPNGDRVGLAVVQRPHDAPGTEVRVGGQPGRVEAFPLDLG
jgi:hypothetical protein